MGERTRSQGKMYSAEIVVQGQVFTTECFLLPLGGCDIVLWMQWLRTLGPILWDFVAR